MHYDFAAINKDFIYLWCYQYQIHFTLTNLYWFAFSLLIWKLLLFPLHWIWNENYNIISQIRVYHECFAFSHLKWRCNGQTPACVIFKLLLFFICSQSNRDFWMTETLSVLLVTAYSLVLWPVWMAWSGGCT